MSDRNRLSFDNLRTTTQLFKQTTAIFSAGACTFIFLSFFLFSFRTIVENGTHLLTSFIDRDPSLRSLLSRLDLAGHQLQLQHRRHHHLDNRIPRRRRPFLHLTRVGTLDADFFSGDDDAGRSLFGPYRKLPANVSSVIFNNFDSAFGFSDFVVDNGVKVSEVVHSGVQFKARDRLIHDRDEETSDYDGNENGEREESGSPSDLDRVVDFQFFINGLEVGRRDAVALLYLVSFLSVAYGWVILGFTAMYSWILGIVFVAVANDLLNRFGSFVAVVWDGSRLGIKRLTGFILMRWAIRDALTQLVGLWYFSEVEDQFSFFKLFVRMKLMPFSIMSPWVRGFEKEISGFLFTWFLLDTFVGLVFAVDAWVTIVDLRRTGREIVREGCYLILTLFNQAVQLKCIEAIICGLAARWLFSRVFGKVLAAAFQAVAEVYFMVAWLIFYFAARCKKAHLEERRFGRRELEGLVDGLR
uniref:Uncharacterized protein MANES_08G008600 n=1 Tax=Rhizophora mucronata TaxID=61149 RepID=A0A2P2L2N8_RHIMU